MGPGDEPRGDNGEDARENCIAPGNRYPTPGLAVDDGTALGIVSPLHPASDRRE